MSTTEQQQIGETATASAPGAPPATAETAPPDAPVAAARASNDVEYILFEEARTDTWTELTTVRAKTPEAAIESLGEAKLKAANGRFMAVASRYATKKKPKVTTVTNIDWD